jgi:hypothetical protein
MRRSSGSNLALCNDAIQKQGVFSVVAAVGNELAGKLTIRRSSQHCRWVCRNDDLPSRNGCFKKSWSGGMSVLMLPMNLAVDQIPVLRLLIRVSQIQYFVLG